MLADTLLLIDYKKIPPSVLTLFCSLLFSLSVLLCLFHIPGLFCLLSAVSVSLFQFHCFFLKLVHPWVCLLLSFDSYFLRCSSKHFAHCLPSRSSMFMPFLVASCLVLSSVLSLYCSAISRFIIFSQLKFPLFFCLPSFECLGVFVFSFISPSCGRIAFHYSLFSELLQFYVF